MRLSSISSIFASTRCAARRKIKYYILILIITYYLFRYLHGVSTSSLDLIWNIYMKIKYQQGDHQIYTVYIKYSGLGNY